MCWLATWRDVKHHIWAGEQTFDLLSRALSLCSVPPFSQILARANLKGRITADESLSLLYRPCDLTLLLIWFVYSLFAYVVHLLETMQTSLYTLHTLYGVHVLS